MQILVGIVSLLFTLGGIGFMLYTVEEIKANGFSLGNVGLLPFSILWIAGFGIMAYGNLFGDGISAVEVFGTFAENW